MQYCVCAAADVHTQSKKKEKTSVLHHRRCYLHVDALTEVCAVFPLIIIITPKIFELNMRRRKVKVKKKM